MYNNCRQTKLANRLSLERKFDALRGGRISWLIQDNYRVALCGLGVKNLFLESVKPRGVLKQCSVDDARSDFGSAVGFVARIETIDSQGAVTYPRRTLQLSVSGV